MTTEGGSAAAEPLSAYLAERPAEVARALGCIVSRAHELVPGLTEGTSYAMAALIYRGKPLLSVVETKKHLGYYPFSGTVVSAVAAELERGGYSFSSGAVRFSVEKPLAPDIVDRLILARREQIDDRLGR